MLSRQIGHSKNQHLIKDIVVLKYSTPNSSVAHKSMKFVRYEKNLVIQLGTKASIQLAPQVHLLTYHLALFVSTQMFVNSIIPFTGSSGRKSCTTASIDVGAKILLQRQSNRTPILSALIMLY